MRPAMMKAPLEYLFALVLGLTMVGTSFVVEPAPTRYVVLGVGIAMTLLAMVVALKPTRVR